jgi:hypothetical protein
MTEYRRTTAFLQFEKGRYPFEAKLVNATAKKPARPKSGAIVVKVEFNIPASAFEPLSPEAIITIEEGLARQVVQVVAADPGLQAIDPDGDAVT